MVRHGSKKSGKPPKKRSDRVIEWFEDHLFIPEGNHVGKPVRVAEFMKDDLRAIYDNPQGTRRAIITRGHTLKHLAAAAASLRS